MCTTKKKVRFILPPVVFVLEDEDRKGPWELFAIDRLHFNHRIKHIETKIGWCFDPQHRKKIQEKLGKVA